jgi:hypothetical protein
MTKLIFLGVKERYNNEKANWIFDQKRNHIYTSDTYFFEYNGKQAEVCVGFRYKEEEDSRDEEVKFSRFYINYGTGEYPRWVNFKIESREIPNLLKNEIIHLNLNCARKAFKKEKIKAIFI